MPKPSAEAAKRSATNKRTKAVVLAATPWDRAPGESFQAFEAFLAYLALGPGRTGEQAAKKVGKSAKLLQDWSVRWRWVERCTEYDSAIAMKQLVTREQSIEAVMREAAQELMDAFRRLVDIAKNGTNADAVRLAATKDLLDRCGFIAPKELIIKGDDKAPLRFVVEVPAKVDDAAVWQKTYPKLLAAAGGDE